MPRAISATAVALVLLLTCPGRLFAEESLDDLLDQLRSPDIGVVRRAQDSLRAQSDEAVPALTALLGSTDPIERRIAALTLGVAGESAAAALPALRAALQDKNFGVRVAAVEALAAMGPIARLARTDLVDLRNAAWWELRNPIVSSADRRSERHAMVLALAEGARSLIDGTSPQTGTENSEIEGLPVAQWVRRLDGIATVGTLDEAGSRDAYRVLREAPPEIVLPHLLHRIRVRWLQIFLGWGPKIRLGDFTTNPLSRLATELVREDPNSLVMALLWGVEHSDALSSYLALGLARDADVEAGVYALFVPGWLSPNLGGDANAFTRRLQDLALDMIPQNRASRRAAVAHLASRIRAAGYARRIDLLVEISRYGEEARGHLDAIETALREQRPEGQQAPGKEVWLGPDHWTLRRDRLQMALWRIQLGLDAPFEALRSTRPSLRRVGIEALRVSPTAEGRVVDALHRALRDPDPDMRRLAAWKLLQAGPAGVRRLRESAEESDLVLGEALSAAARSARTFRDPTGSTRYGVRVPHDLSMDALRLDTTALFDLAVASLDHEDAQRRALAARALGGMGLSAAGAEAPLRGLLATPEAEIRSNAAEALGFFGKVDKETLQALVELLGEDEASVRLAAAHALARLSTGEAFVLDEILASLDGMPESAGTWDRRYLAEAASAIVERHPELQTVLVEALRVVSPKAREALLPALVDLSEPGEPLITEILRCMADDPGSSHLRSDAAIVLVRFAEAGHPVVTGLAQVLAEGPSPAKVESAEALGRIGYRARATVPALQEATGSEDLALRTAATEALEAIRLD